MDKWTTPPELNQPIPRQVSMNSWMKVIIILFNISFLGTAAGIVWLPYEKAREMDVLKLHGISTNADIISFHKAMSSGRYPEMIYYVDYRFHPNMDNATTASDYQKTAQVNIDNYKTLKIGETIPIVYNRDDPDQSAINLDDQVHKNDPYIITNMMLEMVLVIFGGTYLIMMTSILGLYYRDKRLVMWGNATQATITNEKDVRIGGDMSTKAFYQFMDNNGKIVEGSRGGLPTKGYLKYKKYQKFLDAITNNPTVVYDPRNSSRNMLYPSWGATCRLPKGQDKKAKKK